MHGSPDYLGLAAAGLGVVVLLLGTLIRMIASHFQAVHPTGLFQGFRTRTVAMEFAATPEEARRVVGADNRRNCELMWQVQKVNYLFIGAYWCLFVALSAALFPARFAPIPLLAASAAAFFDLQVNRKLGETLGTALNEASRGFVSAGHKAALRKWTCVFLTLLFLALPIVLSPLGILVLVTGLTGLVALASGPAKQPEVTAASRFPYGKRLEFATRLVSLCLIWFVLISMWMAYPKVISAITRSGID